MNAIVKKFLIRAILLFISWVILYYFIIIPDGRLNVFLTQTVIDGTVFGLNLFGYDAHGEGAMVYIDNIAVVQVADGCNGLELFALYIGFLLAFPGKWVYKLFFVPIGAILIFIINVLREIALALNYKFYPETFELNHKYTYVFIVYLFIFLIWRYWLNRYSLIANMQSNED